jgi:hypothetical protein
MNQRSSKLTLALALIAGSTFGCSDDAADSDSTGNAGSGNPLQAGTGAAGTTAGGGGAGASGRASGGTGGSAAGSNAAAGQGGAGRAGSGGGGGGSAFTEGGVCGQRGMGTVKADSYESYEEIYIIGEKGFGDDICVVRFDVKRVGAGREGCDDPAAEVDCLWVHEVEYSNPTVMTDVNGVCAKSELGLDADAIAEIDGSRVVYGFVSEYVGHNSVILQYDEAQDTWIPNGNATWDEDSGAFRFDRRDGACNY